PDTVKTTGNTPVHFSPGAQAHRCHVIDGVLPPWRSLTTNHLQCLPPVHFGFRVARDTPWPNRNYEWRLLTKPLTLTAWRSSTAKPVRRRTQRCFCCTVSRLRRRCSET